MHFILIFLCWVQVLYATTVATTENEPSALVHGVNVITGDLYLLEEDVVVQGVEPLRLERSYVSGKGTGYWNTFSHQRAFVYYRLHMIEIVEPSGARLFYQWQDHYEKKKQKRTFHPIDLKEAFARGIANTARGSISGKTNLKNQSVSLYSDDRFLDVKSPDGTKRVYQILRDQFFVKEFLDWDIASMPEYHPHTYLLVKEDLPSGRQIRYEWPKDKKDVWRIRTCDKKDKHTYSWIKFYPHDGKHGKSHGDYGVETSDGRHLEFSFFTHNKVHQLKQVESEENPLKIYEYLSYGKKKFLTRVRLPEHRFRHINYYLPGDYLGKNIQENDPECFRVKELISPAGEDLHDVITHRFLYDIPNKKTTVLDAYDIPTEYYWNDDLRLIAIRRFSSPGCLHNKEQFVWGKNHQPDASNLLCKIIFDEKEAPIFATRYFYDDYGNVEKVVIYGNLTGDGGTLSLDDQGFPIEGSTECYTKWYRYTKDGKHLLLSVDEENGLGISYSYFRDTSLLEQEAYYDHGAIQKKTIQTYNDEGILIKKFLDDLRGNTRIVTLITPHQASKRVPICTGLPFRVEERQADGHHLLSITELEYGIGGRVQSKKVFDSSCELKQSFQYLYERGCLLRETNLLNQSALSHYDALHNVKCHKDFASRFETYIDYDFMNRPRKVLETGEGVVREKWYEYDYRGHQIASYDNYHNKTSHLLDPWGHVLETTFPSGGKCVYQYDAFGNVISVRDPKGYLIQTQYTVYNKPTKIMYPDGATEKFIYYRDGNLRCHINAEGIETSYTYDALGRVLSKKTPLSREDWTYDSFHVLTETNPDGQVTTYEYDGAGRKICEKKGDEVVSYEYDSFSRLYKTRSGELVCVKEYDLLDRVVCEKMKDAQDHLLQVVYYEYDAAGNLKATVQNIEGKEAKEVLEYDALNRLICQKDAQGHETHIVYDDIDHKKTWIDPLGRREVVTLNPDETVALSETYAPSGELLLQESFHYDLNQNLCRKESCGLQHSNIFLGEYNERNLLTAVTEGFGTSVAKTTKYLYTPNGLLEQTVKPNGIILKNMYDVLGHLSEQISSDGSIHYTYRYSPAGLLLDSTDQLSGKSLMRRYTSQGRLQEEILPSRLSFKNRYDAIGRRTHLELPDNSDVVYEYDAFYLRSVSRRKNFQTLYTHRYHSYDLSGNLLYESSIGNVSDIERHYDTLARSVHILSPYFSEKVISFDPVGNLLTKDRNRVLYSYAYDELYQLTAEPEHQYTYDACFNRLSKDGDPYTSNALNQTSALSYDCNGNPTSWQGKKLIYDALDRLTSVQEEGQTTVYEYDSLHRRISKKIYAPDLVSHVSFLYDGQNEIGAFDQIAQEFVEIRVLGNASRAEMGASVAIELYGKTYVPFHDLQGNIAALLSLSDLSLENYSYTAFGEEDFSTLCPWRFASKRFDPETGFVYYGRRYYIPSLGRWLTQDPLGLQAGPNCYSFVSNSPLIYVDLYGLFLEGIANDIDTNWLKKNTEEYAPAQVFSVGTPHPSTPPVYWVGGIQTSSEEAKEYAALLSESGGGIEVRVIYNPKSSLLGDVKGALWGMAGGIRDPHEYLEQEFQNFQVKYPNYIMCLSCHSDGATHVFNFLKEKDSNQQQRIGVLAIAPATVIPRSMCFKAYNYASTRDFVPIFRAVASRVRFGAQLMNQADHDDFVLPQTPQTALKELIFLKPHSDAKLLDHNFDSPTYRSIIPERINQYIQSGGHDL